MSRSAVPARAGSSTRARIAGLAVSTGVALLAGLAPGAPAALAAPTCSKVAATTGSDANPGTLASPYRTFYKLANSLSAGQTGCLRAGSYVEDGKVTRSGTAPAPITVTSYAGEKVTLRGRMWVAANYVTYDRLFLDGRNSRLLPSPTVNGSHVTFRNNDVTNVNTAICFDLGSMIGYGKAVRPVIDHNRIHHCGRLPAWNHDHGIYVEATENAQITNNLIHDNADRGVQLYPSAQDTYVARNVIDGNGQGVIFSGGEGSYTSNRNIVEKNVITFAKLRYDVEAFWEDSRRIGVGNVLRSNCVYGGRAGTIQTPQVGFTASANVIKDPLYVDRAAKDYRLRSGSPCASVLGTGVVGPEPLTPSATPPAPAGPSVTWRAPIAGQVVRGQLNEAASNCDVSVSSATPVSRVEFLLDGAPLNVERYAPWSCVWDTSRSTVGAHTLTAVAYDSGGASRSAAVSVTVSR